MSEDRVTSPSRFNGDIDHIYDPNFTEEINQKMQVPKRIKVNGENEDDIIIGVGGNHPTHNWENEKFEMHVPERILVVDSPESEYCNPNPRKYLTSSSSPCNLPRNMSSDTTVISVNSNHWRISPSFGVTIPRCDGPLSSRPMTTSSTRSRSRSSPQPQYFQGQEQCVGLKKPPVEVVNHEHIVLPPDPGFVRVQTPPRVISLAEHYFPAVDEMHSPIQMDEPPPPPVIVRANNVKPRAIIDAEGDHKGELLHLQSAAYPRKLMLREGTPTLTEGMTTNEEIAHLRRQLAKLNRRVMSIELENLQRQQYEKIVYAFGIAYVIWKTLIWLRNS